MIHEMSERLVNRLIGAACCVALLSAIALQSAGIFPVSMSVDYGSSACLALLLLLGRHYSVSTKLTMLAAVGIVVAITAISQNPYSPDGFLVIAAVMVLSFTNWSGARALVIPVAAVILIAAVTGAISAGWIHVDFDAGKSQSSPTAWLIVCMTVALLAVVMGGAIKELKNRLGLQVKLLEDSNLKLFDYAYKDEITGLFNRKYLEKTVNSDIAAGRSGTLLVIEFAGFRSINALHGHARCDHILRDIAQLLVVHFGQDVLLAKLPTPQFAVWHPGIWIGGPEAAFAAFISDLESHNAPAKLGLINAGAWVAAPENGTNFETLLKNINVVVRNVTPSSTGRILGFTSEMHQQLIDEYALKVLIREALDKDLFHAAYQAKVRNAGHEIIGFEGLARMREVHGKQPPGPAIFIPVLHAEGWMNEFGILMLRLIIGDIPKLVQKYGAHIKVAANVSPPLFLSPGFVDRLESLLDEAKVSASNLIIEITEEVFAANPEEIMAVNHDLKRLGVSVSLDDFGSGYSSLGYLRTIQFDEIKIDRLFVKSIDTDERLFTLLTTVCKLAHDMQSRVVLEGAETAEQVQRISESNIDYIQGFYFARPEKLETLLLR
jgi:EAL domain-containing protein (putative c-di-GMP-specific phosphodiesterase class I)/GGDEF domain-containing protein